MDLQNELEYRKKLLAEIEKELCKKHSKGIKKEYRRNWIATDAQIRLLNWLLSS